MIIVFEIDDFHFENISFLETKKNNIMFGNFTKIIYSNEYMSLNSIYILFPIQPIKIESLVNKSIITFHPDSNMEVIHKIIQIEKSILEYYTIFTSNDSRKPVNKIETQLLNGNIKIHKTNNERNGKHIALKISGVWENNKYMGITYKFIEISRED
jgi:hypothetical protein